MGVTGPCFPSSSLLAISVALSLGACQSVAFDPPAAGTSDDEGAEPEANPVYNCDPTDLNACAAGQKCTVLEVAGVQNVYDCVDDDGTLMTFSSCTPAPTTGQDSCPKGSVCIAPNADELTGFCMPMCDPNQECSGVCSPQTERNIPLCGDTCNPLEMSCPVILQCHPADENFACQFQGDFHSGGALAECSPSSLEGCAEGFYCAQGSLVLGCEFQSCCTQMCSADAMMSGCEAPHECVAVPDAPPEASNLGICIVPS